MRCRPSVETRKSAMSGFMDLWEEIAAPLLTEQYAGEAICTQPGESQRSVTSTIWPLEVTEEQTQRGVIRKYLRLLGVPRTATSANGGAFVESPGLDDLWNVEGVEYAVEAIESQTDDETVLRLRILATHEETRDGLRRRN